MRKPLRLVLALAAVGLVTAPLAGPHRAPPNRAAAQPAVQATGAPQQAQGQSSATIKIGASLVPIRVVVRDSKGQTIGGLTQEDFQVFDGGAPQKITQFFADHHGGSDSQQLPSGQTLPAPNEERIYTLYLFDDLHLSLSDLNSARDAAIRHLAELAPAERDAIFTTSGQHGIDFTRERDKLQQLLASIKPLGYSMPTCPKLDFFQADLIQKRDENALDDATADALDCQFAGNPKAARAARQFAQTVAAELDAAGRALAERALRILKGLVQGMSKAPGRRTIVVVSDGIFTQRFDAESEIEDLAIQGNVTVNFLDPAGLEAPFPDAPTVATEKVDTILSQLSYGSGGSPFQNNNDLREGFRRLEGAPEYSYVVAFSPDPANLDGKFHKLKVKLAIRKSLNVQARNGYFASKPK
jgi:VWFA-related protein